MKESHYRATMIVLWSKSGAKG